jgi:putative FmdB family regulatory protein
VPTYQYACTECGHQLEAVQSFSDPSLVECPECAGRLRKLFSAVGIVFKGSGFYRTDSRAGSAAASPAKEGARAGSATSDSAGSSTTDSSSSSTSDTSSSSPTTSSTSGSSTSNSSTSTKTATPAGAA